jgi:hypothetical protein
VDVIVETDISVSSSDVELVEENEQGPSASSERRRRREYRANSDPAPFQVPLTNESEVFSLPIPVHTPPLPPPDDLGTLNRRVSCHSCGSIFEIEARLSRSKCPVCDEKIELG